MNKIEYKKNQIAIDYLFFLRNIPKIFILKLLKKSSIKTRVRYAETDKMGIVYHGNYAQFFDLGRTELFRSLSIAYKNIETNGIMLPVISLNCRFIKPALYDDVLTIQTFLKKKPMVKIEFEHKVLNQENELLCTGNSVLAFMNAKTHKPTRCPEYLLKGLGF